MNKIATLVAAGLLLTGLAACTSDERNPAQQDAQQRAANRQNYVPVNDLEGRNYNARQRVADNPATLIWCTAFPTSPNGRAFTVPIVGKLTSGNKRPYPTEQQRISGEAVIYNPELPGPDGMYGSSGEYRYGFDPAGNYHDFYNLETYCTTVPNVVQREQTTIIVKTDTDVALLDTQVEKALKACRDADPDPSKPCPAAARLLGGV